MLRHWLDEIPVEVIGFRLPEGGVKYHEHSVAPEAVEHCEHTTTADVRSNQMNSQVFCLSILPSTTSAFNDGGNGLGYRSGV